MSSTFAPTVDLRNQSWAWWPLLAVAAGVGGYVVTVRPQLLSAVVPVVALPVLVRSGKARVMFAVAGGLLVLGPPNIGLAKLSYLAGLVVVVAVSAREVNASVRDEWFQPFRRVPVAVAILLTGLAFSFVTATMNGISPGGWLRDALPYLLLAVAPVIALGSARDLTTRWLWHLVGVVGAVSAVGFAVDWLSRRGVSGIPVDRLTFSSAALISFAFSVLAVRGMLGPGQIRWSLLAVLLPLAVLVTGSRTALIMLLAFPAVLGQRIRQRVPAVRIAAWAVTCVAALWVAVPVVATHVSTDPDFLPARLLTVERVLSSRAGTDASYAIRAGQTAYATRVLGEYPVLGAGLGYQFLTPGRDHSHRSSAVDSPMGPIAKLGLLGSSLLLLFLGVVASATVRVARERPDTFLTGCGGFAAVFLAQIPFGSYLEDKGLGFAILLIMAGAAAKVKAGAGGVGRARPSVAGP